MAAGMHVIVMTIKQDVLSRSFAGRMRRSSRNALRHALSDSFASAIADRLASKDDDSLRPVTIGMMPRRRHGDRLGQHNPEVVGVLRLYEQAGDHGRTSHRDSGARSV